MNEEKVIQKTDSMPLTVKTLKSAFSHLGVQPGMVLVLHSSLSSLGWVCGGPVAVILALEDLLGGDGTLVMPAHSGSMTDQVSGATLPSPSRGGPSSAAKPRPSIRILLPHTSWEPSSRHSENNPEC